MLEAYVDVQGPALTEVVAGLPDGTAALVVPLLLSVGYHVRVDIARAAASRPDVLAAAPLGPDPRLADVLCERLRGVPADWGIVLAAAGSSDPGAAESVEELSTSLGRLLPQPILAGYGASAQPSVPDAVIRLKAQGAAQWAIASYLLAPGFFHDQLAKAGAELVVAPLLPAEVLAELALERYDQALGGKENARGDELFPPVT